MLSLPAGKYVEADFMLTKDKRLIITHNYSLAPISNATDPSLNVYNTTLANILAYKLLRRDGTVSNSNFLSGEVLLDYAKSSNLIVIADIKEPTGETTYIGGPCIRYCYYNKRKQGQSVEIIRELTRVALAKNMAKNIVIKPMANKATAANLKNGGSNADGTTYSGIGAAVYNRFLWVPRLYSDAFPGSSNSVRASNMAEYEASWPINTIAYFEALYKNANDPIVSGQVVYQTTHYDNLLHFTNAGLGRRNGTATFEPVGRKGGANRWANWEFYEPKLDRRASFKFVLGFVHARTAVITAENYFSWTDAASLYAHR